MIIYLVGGKVKPSKGGKMVNRNIKVALHDDEYAFIKWLAKRDGVTIADELKMLFNLQLSEEMALYEDEWRQEGGK